MAETEAMDVDIPDEDNKTSKQSTSSAKSSSSRYELPW